MTLPRLLIFCRSSSISCCTSSRWCCSSSLGVVLQLGQLDAVILAQPVGQRWSARGGLRWRPARRRASSLPACGSGRGSSESRPASAPRCWLQRLALVDQPDGLRGEGLLAEVEVGDFGLGPQDVPPRGLGPLGALGQMLAGFVDGPLAFLAALLELPHAGLEVPQPLLALGQFDLDLGGLAVGRQAAALQPVDLLAELGRVRLPVSARPASMLFSLFPGFGQAAAGRRRAAAGRRAVRGPATARCWSNWLRRSSAAVMATRFSASASTMLLVFGRAPIDQPLLGGDLLVQLGQVALRRVDRGLPIRQVASAAPAIGCAARSGRSRRCAARRSACRRVRAVRRQA